MLLELAPEHAAEMLCSFGPERCQWDSRWDPEGKILHRKKSPVAGLPDDKQEEDFVLEARILGVPKLVKWAMGIPEICVWRGVTRPLLDGGIAYVFASWDKTTNSLSKSFELVKSGTVRGAVDVPGPPKTVLMDFSERATWIPNWLLGKMMSGMAMAQLRETVKKYLHPRV